MDVRDLQFGELWEQRISAEIEKCERVVVFWSRHALKSDWVSKEISMAIKLEKRIVPVLMGDVEVPPSLSAFHGIHNFELLLSEAMESLKISVGLHYVGRNLVQAFLTGGEYRSVRG